MKKIILAVASLFVSATAFAWSQKGHDVTAHIAERHLTPQAAAMVDSLLEGKSMVYWSNWLDNASHTATWAYTSTWHYRNVDEGVRYEEAPANPSGDCVTAVKMLSEKLASAETTFKQKQEALKMLIHIVGDMHQPMHMGHATDLGGNRIKVKFFGRDSNLHSVWDGSILESGHKWSYTEWADQVDRVAPGDSIIMVMGTPDDWAKQTLGIASAVYREMPEGSKISYNEVARWTPVIELQLVRGGQRLAHILNNIFK